MLKSSDVAGKSNESQEVQDMIDMLSAYWKLATKRYIDEVSMVITDVYTSISQINQIERVLGEALLIDCDDGALKQLFRQSPQLERRRAELVATRKQMLRAQARLAQGVVAAS